MAIPDLDWKYHEKNDLFEHSPVGRINHAVFGNRFLSGCCLLLGITSLLSIVSTRSIKVGGFASSAIFLAAREGSSKNALQALIPALHTINKLGRCESYLWNLKLSISLLAKWKTQYSSYFFSSEKCVNCDMLCEISFYRQSSSTSYICSLQRDAVASKNKLAKLGAAIAISKSKTINDSHTNSFTDPPTQCQLLVL